jgi:hypothetical protein
MSWITIKEYIQRFGVSDSTIRRRIRSTSLKSKRIGSKILVWADDDSSLRTALSQQVPNLISSEERSINQIQKFAQAFPEGIKGEQSLTDVIAFSSKALNSYLMVSDKLVEEKDKRIEEKDSIIRDQKQKISELESYIKILEGRY